MSRFKNLIEVEAIMKTDTHNAKKQAVKLPYEQPSLTKWGTMKSLTLNTMGSAADFMALDAETTTM